MSSFKLTSYILALLTIVPCHFQEQPLNCAVLYRWNWHQSCSLKLQALCGTTEQVALQENGMAHVQLSQKYRKLFSCQVRQSRKHAWNNNFAKFSVFLETMPKFCLIKIIDIASKILGGKSFLVQHLAMMGIFFLGKAAKIS